MISRYFFAISAFVSLAAPAAGADLEDIFDMSPPNSVGFATTGDSDGGRTGSFAFSATLPKDWIFFGNVGRRVIDADGESIQLGNWLFGISSDPMETWQFETSVDQQLHRGLYSDTGLETRATYRPGSGLLGNTGVGLLLGARRFRFESDPLLAARREVDIGSYTVGISVEVPFAKRWLARFEAQRSSYPEQIKDLGDDLATLVVPSDTLNYALGISEAFAKLNVVYSFQRPRKYRPTLALDLSASRSAVDQSTWGSAGLIASARLTKSWNFSLSYFTARTVVNAQRSEPTKTIGTALMYSWK
jgi:hypothetical protein